MLTLTELLQSEDLPKDNQQLRGGCENWSQLQQKTSFEISLIEKESDQSLSDKQLNMESTLHVFALPAVSQIPFVSYRQWFTILFSLFLLLINFILNQGTYQPQK